jgi:hypothetical protein
MAVSDEQLLEQPQLEHRMCLSCLRLAHLSHTVICTNRVVRIYECQCGRQFSEMADASHPPFRIASKTP